MRPVLTITLVVVVLQGGCSAQMLERDFFDGAIATRNERLTGYSMEDQWKIFLYGNQVIHPPVMTLASPLARRGGSMFRFILSRLEITDRDLDYRDSLTVFQSMQQHGDYLVCEDIDAMKTIQSNQQKIRNLDWRRVYGEMLSRLCRN